MINTARGEIIDENALTRMLRSNELMGAGLDVYENAPLMPHGYLTMLYLALFMPPVFHKMMARKLIDWDNEFASKNERKLAEKQNLSSGLRLLQKNSQAFDMGL